MTPPTRTIGRRAAVLLPLAATGCSVFDNIFGPEPKPSLPGKRLSVLAASRSLQIDNPPERKIALPPPTPNPDWAQAGGVPSHSLGHLAAREVPVKLWTAGIGAAGGYRAKITATPVVQGRRVVTMDSNGVVAAHDTRTGERLWRTETQGEKDRSTNLGGGVIIDGDRVYAATGRAELLSLASTDGRIVWRVPLGSPARAAPTLAEGRLFVPTLADEIRAFAAGDGRPLWSYQANTVDASILSLPSPAYADGVVVAGFASGELIGLRADGGSVAWADSLAATRGRNSLIDLPTITAMPVIDRGQVFASGLGGLTVSLDLRTGRRLWAREVGAAGMPWLAGDWLFLLSIDAELVAINRTDGTVAWVTPLPKFENDDKKSDAIHWIGPTLVSDRLIVAGSLQRAVALSPYTGRVLGRQELPGAASVPVVVADGTIFVVTDDATLLALR